MRGLAGMLVGGGFGPELDVWCDAGEGLPVLVGRFAVARTWIAVALAWFGAWAQGCRPAREPAPTESGGAVYVENRPFLTRENDFYVADRQLGHRHRPDAEREYPWPEHAQGKIVLRTNNLGFREDRDTRPIGREEVVTVLVTGDSHTDGVVWNEESFPNLLEIGLTRDLPHARFEVINGGVGYYGIYNYARWIEKYSFLDPALAIVTVYSGNDFLDSCRVLEATGRPNPRPPDYFSRMGVLRASWRRVAGQHLNQALYFSVYPSMREAALEHAEHQLLDLAHFCRNRGMELLVLILPDKLEAQRDRAAVSDAATALGIDEEQLLVGRDLGNSLASRLARSGIPVIDLEPAVAGATDAYWQLDHHLSSAGHRRVADHVLEHERNRFRGLAPIPRQPQPD